MFFRITNSVKKIIIQELQTFFNDHPVFCDGLVITNKFSFEEKPKYAIILKTASADSQKLGLDNFEGIVNSYVTLAGLKNKPGRMIEWVCEDVNNIANVVKPGFYVVEMTEDNLASTTNNQTCKFIVKPFLTVADEVLNIETNGFKHAFLKYQNINNGSDVILSEAASRLVRNEHYTIDYVSGEITFLQPIDNFGELVIDYQYLGDQTGPFDILPETFNNTAIPGVTLAFGNFLKEGGVQVVVVYPDRQEVAKAYMGKWKMNVNMSVYAQDTDTQEQLADLAAMYIWSVLQEKLVNDGIYIENFNISGESEEEEVKISNEMAFLADVSFTVNVEWHAYQPILGIIKKVFLTRIQDFGQYDNDEFNARSDRLANSSQRGVDYKLGLQPVENLMPYLVRPVPRYTLISSNTSTL